MPQRCDNPSVHERKISMMRIALILVFYLEDGFPHAFSQLSGQERLGLQQAAWGKSGLCGQLDR